MKQQRLDGLADGIFAIAMTFLAFDFKLPVVGHGATDLELFNAVISLWPVFMSMTISFALLFTYWRAHHFIVSVYAKNITVELTNINGLFLLLITLIPFAARFLGEYPSSRVSIIVYGLLVIAIGLVTFYMRRHIETNPKIETSLITKAERRSGYIRILFPVFSAAVAIIISYWDTTISMAIYTIAILFNILPASSNIIHHWLDVVFEDDGDVIEGNFVKSEPEMVVHKYEEEYIRD